MKSTWQSKLFLFYIKVKKPFIFFLIGLTALLMFLDLNYRWEQHKFKTADHTPWTLKSVETGNSFVVTRHDQTKRISLCGVSASGDRARDFLRSVINLGDGTVIFEEAGSNYEAWILLEPDYDVELVKHISDKPNDLVESQIHLNTWLIERGVARQDLQSSDRCREPEHLAWAEDTAKKSKLGIWKDK